MDKRFVELFKGTAHGAVHERKGNHGRGNYRGLPGKYDFCIKNPKNKIPIGPFTPNILRRKKPTTVGGRISGMVKILSITPLPTLPSLIT